METQKDNCSTCNGSTTLDYRSGKRFYYCIKWPDKKTWIGFKKVKARYKCQFYKDKSIPYGFKD